MNDHVAKHSYRSVEDEIAKARGYVSALNRSVLGGLAHGEDLFVHAFAFESLCAQYNFPDTHYGRETYKNAASDIEFRLAQAMGYFSIYDKDFLKKREKLTAEVIAWFKIMGVEQRHIDYLPISTPDASFHHWVFVYDGCIQHPERIPYYLVGIHGISEINQFIADDIDAELAAKTLGVLHA